MSVKQENYFYLFGAPVDGLLELVHSAFARKLYFPGLDLPIFVWQESIKLVQVVMFFHPDPPMHWVNVGLLIFCVLQLQHIVNLKLEKCNSC